MSGFGGSETKPGNVKVPEVAAQSVEAASAVEALRFDRIKNLVGLLGTLGPIADQLQGLLSKIDVSKLPALLGAVQELFAAGDFKSRVLAGLKLARIFTAITPGETDNALLDKIDGIISNPALLDLLLGVLNNLPNFGTQAAPGTVSVMSVEALGTVLDNPRVEGEESTGAKFEAAGFNLAAILSIVQIIGQVLAAFNAIRKDKE